jgi:hypothetical protein
MCSHSIWIASYKQENPPWLPPHKARPTTPSVPTQYILNLCTRSSNNQGRHWISLHFSQIRTVALYIEAIFKVCRVSYNNSIFIAERKNLQKKFTYVS